MKPNDEQNRKALDNPRPGDYWHEMFCPYFLVVNVKGKNITVLSCLGGEKSLNRKHEPNAKIGMGDRWTFDIEKDFVVDREWMEKAVKYFTFDGFCADVTRSAHTEQIAENWRIAKAAKLRKEWEDLTGWTALTNE